jgi:hypothetical protein
MFKSKVDKASSGTGVKWSMATVSNSSAVDHLNFAKFSTRFRVELLISPGGRLLPGKHLGEQVFLLVYLGAWWTKIAPF